MTRPADRPLNADELAFLTGSLFAETLTAAARIRKPPLAFRALLRLVRRARQAPPLRAAEAAALAGRPRASLPIAPPAHLDPQRDRRYAAGLSLLSAGTMSGGLLAAYGLLLWRAVPSGLRKALKPPRRLRFAGGRRRAGPLRLEPWDDDASEAWEPLPPPGDFETDEPFSDAAEIGASSESARNRPKARAASPVWRGLAAWEDPEPGEPDAGPLAQALWSREEAAFGPSAPTEAQTEAFPEAAGAASAEPSRPRLAAQTAAWLASLGAKTSGVRIEPYAERLVGLLEPQALRETAAFAARPGGDRLALTALEEGLRGERLKPGERLALRRLASIFVCLEEGHPPPPPRLRPEYEPVPGSVFYLLHMRDPYESNGYVSRTRLVLTAMKAAGLKPTAVTRLGFPQDLARHRRASIEEETILDGTPTLSLLDPRNGQFGRPVADYIDAYAERIVELARERRPAFLHAASNHVNGLAAIKAGRILGIPAIYEVRGIWEITQASADAEYAGTLRYRLQRRLENLAAASADRTAVISEPLRRFVIAQGADPARVSILPNGVDADQMRPIPRDPAAAAALGIGPEEVVLGYVGSVVRYEGLDYVVRALRALRDQGLSGFRFLCVGDGTELEALRRLAADLGVADLCLFLGRVPRAQVEGLYSLIDVAPLPRRSLPVTELVPPLKPFEAMAAGKTAIVSSVEAIADMVVHERTGLVVRKDDPADLTAALKRAISDPDLRRRLGQAARAWVVRERSVPALAARIATLYEGLGAAEKPAPAPRGEIGDEIGSPPIVQSFPSPAALKAAGAGPSARALSDRADRRERSPF